MNYLDLPAPHGFLIWRGKQTAIASSELLECNKELIIVSNDEAFGYATLDSEPVRLSSDSFDRDEYFEEHRVTPEQKQLQFENVKEFYLYRLTDWKPFKETRPFDNGQIVDSGLSENDKRLIDKLPKTIVLDKNAVTLDGSRFTSTHKPEYISKVLKATYGIEVKEVDSLQPLSLYQLVLVRVPNPRVKKNVKQEGNMPWEVEERDGEFCVIKVDNGDVEGCHDTRDEANDQLAALNIAEDERGSGTVATGIKADHEENHESSHEESISQFVKRVDEQFRKTFDQSDDFGLWVREIFNSHIIASDDGVLFRVSYMDTETGVVIFLPRTAWVEVEVSYVDKAATLLKRFDDPNQILEPTQTWKDKLKAAAKTVLDFVGSNEDDKQETDIISALDFSEPYGIASKDVDGKSYHITWSTNAFEDREGEIFSTKALKDYVDESQKRKVGDRGMFDFWHIPGTDFAEKEFQAVLGRFLIEAGPYLDSETGQKAKEFFAEYPKSHPDIAPEGWGASPMFKYQPEDKSDNIYDWLWITKTSTLPRASAANFYTEGDQTIMDEKQLSEQQLEGALKIWGRDHFEKEIMNRALKRTEELEATVNFKDNSMKSDKELQEEDQSKEFDLDLEELAKQLGKYFEVSFTPALDEVKELSETVKELIGRMDKIDKTEEIKKDNNTPRFVVNMITRASESGDTEVKDGDSLKNAKPQEKENKEQKSHVMDAIFANR